MKPKFRVWFLVSAESVNGYGCFCDGMKEEEARKTAEEWKRTGKSSTGEKILPLSVEVTEYHL